MQSSSSSFLTRSQSTFLFFLDDTQFWLFDLENDPFEEINLYDSEEAEHVAAKETLYAKLDDYSATAFEVTNDFSANRASFQVWKSHDNWMVPYAKSSDFNDSKGGSYPHDDFEENCFNDDRRLTSADDGVSDMARQERKNTDTRHTNRVIRELIEGSTKRRRGLPATPGFAAAAFDRRHSNGNLRRI